MFDFTWSRVDEKVDALKTRIAKESQRCQTTIGFLEQLKDGQATLLKRCREEPGRWEPVWPLLQVALAVRKQQRHLIRRKLRHARLHLFAARLSRWVWSIRVALRGRSG